MKNQFKVFSPQKRRKFYPTDLELILHKVKNRTKVLILKSIVLRTNTQVVEQEFKVNFHLYLLPKSIRVQSNFQDGFKKKSGLPQISLCAMEERWQILVFPSLPIQNRLNVRYSLLYAHMQIICFQHISLVSFATISTALIYYLQ